MRMTKMETQMGLLMAQLLENSNVLKGFASNGIAPDAKPVSDMLTTPPPRRACPDASTDKLPLKSPYSASKGAVVAAGLAALTSNGEKAAAAEAVTASVPTPPVLSTLTPRAAFQALVRECGTTGGNTVESALNFFGT
jgi:hypothetical protein